MDQHEMTQSEGTAVDPVCGMKVVIDGAQHISEYQGATYYFCGKGCRLEFEDDPERILAPGYTPSM
jgi:YHS domain-containing protein